MATARRLGALAVAVSVGGASLALAAPASASASTNELVYAVDASGDGAYSVALRDLETRSTTTLLPADATQGIGYDRPELSPDGSRVVVSRFQPDSTGTLTGGLVVVNHDGSGLRTLTAPAPTDTVHVDDVLPAWSPDGSTILFSRVVTTKGATTADPSSLTTSLMTVSAAATAAGTETAVPGGNGGLSADYDPTGSKIVFADASAGQGTGPLMVMATDGSGRTPLGVSGTLPAWSPDGSTIAYATVTDPDPTGLGRDVLMIATVPAAGGTEKRLPATRPSTARTAAEYPAWSADGESLIYDLSGFDASGVPTDADLYAVDRDGVRAGKLLATAGDEVQAYLQGPKPAPVTAGAASRYTSVTPTRILDTREGVGTGRAKVPANTPLVLTVRGTPTDKGPVPANASAVVLNVTVTGPTRATDVRVYPSDAGIPRASNLNAAAGQTVPNLVTATVGADGRVTLLSSAGSVDLVADLAGWYAPDATGSGFTALAPARILDTRSPAVGAPARRVGTGGTLDVQVTGSALPTADGGTVSVPSDATAVVLNVTGAGATSATDVRVYPAPASPTTPRVSNLNLRAGETAPNLVTVAVGSGGKIRFRNAAGSVDLIADIAGYYSASSTGTYVPVVPVRFLDTRSAIGAAPTPVTANGYSDLKVAGARGVPANALAAVLNLTATGTTAVTDVRAFPEPTGAGSATPPRVSNLNLQPGATRANLAIVKPGADGRVRVLNRAGQLDLVGDLAGYFVTG
ncbi:MAG: N-acetylmuramoyl-L-alanine amidase [Frankiales bacterium]|nr:N-acetylmuramoyl-L-alanine amidase [Frankiales bacterium]